jgi:argininosuccinate synthase
MVLEPANALSLISVRNSSLNTSLKLLSAMLFTKDNTFLLGTSIARPCISKEMIRIATEEGAQYIGHSATGKGNDQVGFEMCTQALSPTIQCVSPWRVAKFIESFKGCSDLLTYCNTHGIPVDAKPKSNYHSEGTQ